MVMLYRVLHSDDLYLLSISQNLLCPCAEAARALCYEVISLYSGFFFHYLGFLTLTLGIRISSHTKLYYY